MTCERCQGLMLRDLLDKHDSGLRWLWGWRCVSCGNWVDSIVHQKRSLQTRLPKSIPAPWERQRRRAPLPEDVEEEVNGLPRPNRFWGPPVKD